MLRIPFFLLSWLLAAPFSFAQEPANANQTDNSSELDNKHVRIVRYVVAPQHEVALPKLAKESVLVCLRGNSLKRVPEKGATEAWDEGPGSAIWNRGGIAYLIENRGETPAEFLVVELKDSYAIGQISVPWSERDPAYLDPRHFRVVMENEDVRVLRLHLGVREATEKSQFATRLEIPLGNLRMSKKDSQGKTQEERQDAGSVTWEEDKLESITNIGVDPLDTVIFEFKHPFCYKTEFTDPDPSVQAYANGVMAGVRKKWLTNMPRIAREGEKGLVVLSFRVQRDGIVPDDGIIFESVFANHSLTEKVLTAIRQAEPFPALPPAFDKPFITLRFVFLYNLPPRRPIGCP